MKRALLIALLSFVVAASNLEQFCSEGLNKSLGEISFFHLDEATLATANNSLHLFDENGVLLISKSFDQPIIDISTSNNSTYVLLPSKIIKINNVNLNTEDSYDLKLVVQSSNDLPHGFTIKDETFYIAYGKHGLVKMNMNDRELKIFSFTLPHDKGQISKTTGVAINGTDLFLLYDNVTYDFSTNKRAFEGVVMTSLEQLNNYKAISIRADREALHEGNLYIRDGKLYSQNLHILFEYDLNKLKKAKYFWPQRRLFNFEGNQILGRATVKNKTISGCFKNYDQSTDSFTSFFSTVKI